MMLCNDKRMMLYCGDNAQKLACLFGSTVNLELNFGDNDYLSSFFHFPHVWLLCTLHLHKTPNEQVGQLACAVV